MTTLLAITDWVVLGCFLLFFGLGWKKGFLRSVFGPIALLLGGFLGYVYFLKTGKLLISLLISIVGPFILNFIFSLLVGIVAKKPKDDAPAFSVGRLLGGLFSLAWSGVLLLLMVLLIALVPIDFRWLTPIKNDIQSSYTYQFLKKFIDEKSDQLKQIQESALAFQDPATMEKLQKTEEFQSIMKHEKVQALFPDAESAKKINDQIQSGDFQSVLNNPKISAILQDEDLMAQFMKLIQRMQDQQLVDQKSDDKKPEPKVMEKKKGSWQIVY